MSIDAEDLIERIADFLIAAAVTPDEAKAVLRRVSELVDIAAAQSDHFYQ
jgi:hypothetical protein